MANDIYDLQPEKEDPGYRKPSPTQQSQALEKIQSGGLGQALPPSEIKAPTAQEMRVVEVTQALEPAYAKASTLEMTDEELAALMEPFPDDAVEIRPHDGLIYIPHIMVSNRLNKVFKPGKWALIRRREWYDTASNVIYGEYVLLIRGCYVGESIGGHPYIKNNPKSNYSDALEATAAEALRRIAGKRLSCGDQVWQPDYARQWCAKFSEFRGGKYYRKPVATAPTPAATQAKPAAAPSPAPAPAPAAPPVAKPAPSKAAPVKAAPVKAAPQDAQDDLRAWLLNCKDRLLALLKVNLFPAWQYAVEEGWILETEKLDQASLSKMFPAVDWGASIKDNTPAMQARKQEIMEQIAVITDSVPNGEMQSKFAAVYVEDTGGIPSGDAPPVEDGPPVSEPPGTEPEPTVPRDATLAEAPGEDEWWREVEIHFGRAKGSKLGEMDKRYLYGWWRGWQPSPYKGVISDTDAVLRKALDAAGEHYQFKAD